MYLQRFISTLPLFLLFICDYVNSQPNVFDITKEGAIANGNTDSSQAVMSAWKKACGGGGTILVPKGRYALGQVVFLGPCKGAITLDIEGTFEAPSDPAFLKGGFWVTFSHVDQLTIFGAGTFDGQGHISWQQNDCNLRGVCIGSNLYFNAVTNSKVQGITSLNSKNFHVIVNQCKHLTFQGFKAIAPANSPNTDGIHIGRSQFINIIGSSFSTGDDCISMGDGTQNVNITSVTCGPGHGISIGSLGLYPNELPVSGIFVQHSTISNTLNGVRIKSWAAKYVGSASNIHFQDITMNNVLNPVIIDQNYCPQGGCTVQQGSRVKINNVSFKDIRGTSATPVAVQLTCNSLSSCTNVQLNNINLLFNGAASTSQCTNVKPTIIAPTPPGCT